MQVDGRNLMVVVASVVKRAGFEVVTVGINGDFVLIIAEVRTATLLIDRMKNVEELADIAELVVVGEGIEFGKGGFDKARLGTEIAWEADGTHAATIGSEFDTRGEIVDGFFGGEMLVVVKLEKLFVKRRVVGKDADGVIVNLEAVFYRFDSDASARFVGDEPVELASGELVGET